MKNIQKGFVGIIIIVVVALAAIGGGAYVYTQNKERVVVEDENMVVDDTNKEEVRTETVEADSTVKAEIAVNSLKTHSIYTQRSGIYTVKYPSAWKYVEKGLDTYFETTIDGIKQVIMIQPGFDLEYTIKLASKGIVPAKVSFGSNNYTKLVYTSNTVTAVSYLLPIIEIKGQTTYISVFIEEKTKISKDDLSLFLSSIKVDTTKAIEILKVQGEKIAIATVKSYVNMLRANAELYYNEGQSYAGMCNIVGQKTIDVGMDKIYTGIAKVISSDSIYCKSTDVAYVYSAKMPNGETYCVDNTGFSGAITTNPKSTSCK